ncbi:MAG: alpha/beta fold hydrolase [Bryobacteraceae bacterium]
MRRIWTAALMLAWPAVSQTQEQIAHKFVDLLAHQDFTKAEQYFDPQVAALMPASKLEAVWESVVSKAGPYSRELGIRTQSMGPRSIVVVDCQFAKRALSIQLVLNGDGKISGLHFLPYHAAVEAKIPEGVTEKPLDVLDLPGTLTIPQGTGPFPGLVLVHGSGPNDRDETIGPNKPFRDLAWGLAARGIAVYRYDKRTRVHPQLIAGFTVKEEVTDDALAAVNLLRKTAQIDPKRIFVLGHSLGGMLLPRIGKADPGIAGLISMAGETQPLEDVIVRQIELLAPAKVEQMKEQAEAVKNMKPGGAPAFGVPASYWLDLRGYNPAELAKTLKQPMLILQGERDYQVTMKDFEAWKKALTGRPNVTFKTYPSLNHLFLAGEGESRPAEYQTPGRVPDAVLDDVAKWIKEPAGASRNP